MNQILCEDGVLDLCTTSRTYMSHFMNMIMNFGVNKMRIIVIWLNNYQLLKDGCVLLN